MDVLFIKIMGRYGRYQRAVSSFVFSVFFFSAVFCSAETPSRADLLVEQAINERLYEDAYWRILLHYKKGSSGWIDSSEKGSLLSYAVNYAATGDDINGLLFAFKGVFGFYREYFSILPYYEKVKEYGDLDHRDIWEYRLDLTPDEVNRMMLHLWELQEIYSDYFFFDENCSYTLLFLLDALSPDTARSAVYTAKERFSQHESELVLCYKVYF